MGVIRPHLIGEVAPLEAAGLTLNGGLYEGDPTRNGRGIRRDISFRKRRRMPILQRRGEARISYIEFERNRALFIGMLVDKNLRGQNLGRHLFQYFLEHVERNGLSFVGTGKIHKPLIALALSREGLKPKSQQHIAEILPTSAPDASVVPTVRFLRHDPSDQNVVAESPFGARFYDTPRRQIDSRTLPINLDRVVALHTGYRPAPEQADLPVPVAPSLLNAPTAAMPATA